MGCTPREGLLGLQLMSSWNENAIKMYQGVKMGLGRKSSSPLLILCDYNCASTEVL